MGPNIVSPSVVFLTTGAASSAHHSVFRFRKHCIVTCRWDTGIVKFPRALAPRARSAARNVGRSSWRLSWRRPSALHRSPVNAPSIITSRCRSPRARPSGRARSEEGW